MTPGSKEWYDFRERYGRSVREALLLLLFQYPEVRVLHGCFDDSGKLKDEKVCFCGWISDMNRWGVFWSEWRKFLASNGLTSLHVGDLMKKKSSQRPELNLQQKTDILFEAMKIANTYSLAVAGCSIDCEAFNRMSPTSRILPISQGGVGKDAHTLCFTGLVRVVVDTLEKLKAEEANRQTNPVAMLFDDDAEYSIECYQLLDLVKQRNPLWRKWLGSICFADDELYPPLQAADALSWLTRKSLRKESPPDGLQRETIKYLIDIGIKGKVVMQQQYSARVLEDIDRQIKERNEI